MTTLRGVLALCACVATRGFAPAGGARILAVAPFDGTSHWNVMRGVLRALTDRGHHVTVFTPFPDGDRDNYTEVDASGEFTSFSRISDNAAAVRSLVGPAEIVRFTHVTSRDACKTIYGSAAVRRAIHDAAARSYDAVFVELMASECVSHLSVLLNGTPLVYVTPPPLVLHAERSTLGHFPHPATVSHVLADHGVPRTFAQRLADSLLLVYTSCALGFRSWRDGVVDPQPFDRAEPVKPSVVFSNAHYVADAARPLPPNVVPIGGIHLEAPKKLPDDILEFIENSPHGVVYFTLGSIVPVSALPKHVQEAIIETLGQIPQRVILKYKNEMKNKPKNVMTRKWLPQRDILLHQNVKLFISHGGISSVYEAVDAGVPVVGFPILFDQHRNIDNLVDAGMAVSMDLSSVSKDTFLSVVLELVNNKEYTKNAKIASRQFKDRPMSPAEAVDYWTRYVIRHKGALHLKSHALELTWYQYFVLDVIVAWSLMVGLVVYTVIFMTRLAYRYFIVNVISSAIFKSK